MPLNLHHLAVFHAVANSGNVTRAAEHLMVSQPAVSKQIKTLERAVGTTLLERHGRGILLTDAGRVLASHARSIFAMAEEAERALADLAALRGGTLAVGVTPTIGTYLLPDVLVYFRQRFPGIRVAVQTANAKTLSAALAEGAIELVLGDETVVSPQMQRRQFMLASFVAVAPASHRLSRKRQVTFADLASESMVVREPESSEGWFVHRRLAELGFAASQPLELGSTEAIKRAVLGGLGIAVVPRLAVEGEIADRKLVVLRMPELSIARPLYEIWDSRRTRSKASRAFHCVIEHAVRGTLPKRPRKI